MAIPRSLIQKTTERCGLGEHVVRRLLASLAVRVPVEPTEDGEMTDRKEQFEVGLRIDFEELLTSIASGGATAQAALLCGDALTEYRNACPQMIERLARDDFQPDNLWRELPKSTILHASRTAGRLRAALYRAAKRGSADDSAASSKRILH